MQVIRRFFILLIIFAIISYLCLFILSNIINNKNTIEIEKDSNEIADYVANKKVENHLRITDLLTINPHKLPGSDNQKLKNILIFIMKLSIIKNTKE